jgi:hypothetical protein
MPQTKSYYERFVMIHHEVRSNSKFAPIGQTCDAHILALWHNDALKGRAPYLNWPSAQVKTVKNSANPTRNLYEK